MRFCGSLHQKLGWAAMSPHPKSLLAPDDRQYAPGRRSLEPRASPKRFFGALA
jgi:hypothetical protein